MLHNIIVLFYFKIVWSILLKVLKLKMIELFDICYFYHFIINFVITKFSCNYFRYAVKSIKLKVFKNWLKNEKKWRNILSNKRLDLHYCHTEEKLCQSSWILGDGNISCIEQIFQNRMLRTIIVIKIWSKEVKGCETIYANFSKIQ